MSDVPTVSNVRQDLNEWQARHATLVLSTVKVFHSVKFISCVNLIFSIVWLVLNLSFYIL